MNDQIIIALITVFGSMLSSMALVNWRLKKLEEKVESHNGYAKMFAESATSIALIQKDIEYIKKDLSSREK